MIPTLHLPRPGARARIVSTLADFLEVRARGVNCGDEASQVHDAIKFARGGRINRGRAGGYRARLARVLDTTTDTSFPAAGRAKRDGILRATIELCGLIESDLSDVNASAAAILAHATTGDTATEADAAGRALVDALTLAGVVAPVAVE